jgi:hypothetical protein
MQATYYTLRNYGNDQKYIVEEKISRALYRLNGHRTMTDSDQLALEQLGFTFTEVIKPK